MKEKKKRSKQSWIRRQFRYVIVLLFIAGGLYYVSNRPPTITINSDGNDMLFYTYSKLNEQMPDPNVGMLMMYNPRTNHREALMPRPRGWEVSPDGRIAYRNEENNIVVSDVQSIEHPQAIIETYSDMPTILSWSPNGNYLLYSEEDANYELLNLYIWDSRQSIDITPDELLNSEDDSERIFIHSSTWSNHEQLAIIVGKEVDESKWYTVYVWDGEQIIDITPEDLRNPIPSDKSHYIDSIIWSDEEQFAFTVRKEVAEYTWQDYTYTYIWNGQSIYTLAGTNGGWSSDGQLMISRSGDQSVGRWDGETYIDDQPILEIIPELHIDSTVYHASYWAHENKIVYEGEDDTDGYSQFYLWDGVEFSYIDRLKIGMGEGRWGFNANGERKRMSNDPTIGQHGAIATSYIHIRDRNNNPIADINGHMPAWSEDGYIALCAPLHRLSIYNGQDIILIEDSWTVLARWKSGQSLGCTNG